MAVQQIIGKKITKFDTSNPNYQEKSQPKKEEVSGNVRDGKDFGKITNFWLKGALVEPIPKQKGVTWLYDIKYLKPSIKNGKQERNVGRPVWTKGR